MRTIGMLCCAAALCVVAEGCYGSARRSEPITQPMKISVTRGGDPADGVAHGQRVFMRQCQQCHPGGEAGLGPAINSKALPHFLIRMQIRNGLGAMPAFSEKRISNEEMDQLMEYLSALKDNG